MPGCSFVALGIYSTNTFSSTVISNLGLWGEHAASMQPQFGIVLQVICPKEKSKLNFDLKKKRFLRASFGKFEGIWEPQPRARPDGSGRAATHQKDFAFKVVRGAFHIYCILVGEVQYRQVWG